jgi:predicted adenine nucleotide alpha hydrolase (AANH) superfamily ATPase
MVNTIVMTGNLPTHILMLPFCANLPAGCCAKKKEKCCKKYKKGKRCKVCFDIRLFESARYAKENKFEVWTTVLSISPHKDTKQINEVGERIANVIGLPFISADWKKQDGFKIASQLSKQAGFYRQDYCGCIYSKNNKSNDNSHPELVSGSPIR